jgi:hypothetical protein
MLTKFNCKCGNNDPRKTKEYDGALGYEAVICLKCGRYYDHEGIHEAETDKNNVLYIKIGGGK